MSAGGAFLPACGFSIKQYQKELAIARNRILEGSRVVKTARGLIEYSTAGQGSPVLYIHGAGGGHDMGLLFALRHPDRCSAVVLVSAISKTTAKRPKSDWFYNTLFSSDFIYWVVSHAFKKTLS